MPEASRPSAPAYSVVGVDLDRADRLKRRLAALATSTLGPESVEVRGGFGGAFAIDELPEADPVLVSSADGVGTKLLVAQQSGRHDTVGEDLVNHCVNDLLAAWARPLFFLDYIAAGRLDPDMVLGLVTGLARGCRENQVALLGGETAEMPDLYSAGRYDLAGFIVGVTSRTRLARRVETGDVVLGLPSNGLHTNGYSLARQIVFETAGQRLEDQVPWGAETWADALLAVHRSYRDEVLPLLDDPALHAVAHVTGGGFAGNLPRVLPDGLAARLDRGAWTPPPLFGYLAGAGGVADEEMYRVFNMGIGVCLVVAREHADRVAALCEGTLPIGSIVEGEGVCWT